MYGRVFVCLILVSMFLLRKPLKEELQLFVDDYVNQREDLQGTSMKDLYEAVRQRFNLTYAAAEMRKKIKVMASSAVRETLRNVAEEDERTHVAKRRSRCARA